MIELSFIRPAFEQLYTGRATVEVYETYKDPVTKKTVQSVNQVHEDLPCRLSHESKSVSDSVSLPQADQTIMLFTYPSSEVLIPSGSKITVTQDGVTEVYAHSGIVNNFETHQQIELTLWNGWAGHEKE